MPFTIFQIASRELGIPKEMIYISDSNTKTAPNSVITAASMGTEIYAPAVMVNIRKRFMTFEEKFYDISFEE